MEIRHTPNSQSPIPPVTPVTKTGDKAQEKKTPEEQKQQAGTPDPAVDITKYDSRGKIREVVDPKKDEHVDKRG